MKLKEFDILLDIKRNKKVEEFEIVQGDYEANILKISLVEDFSEYELSGLNVEIAFAKSDGTTVLQDLNNGIELIGNKIVCTLKTNTIASPGKVLAEVRILQGLKLLTSSRFSFFVRQSIVNDKTIESTNEFPILNKMIEDVTGLLDEIQSKPEIQGYSAYQVWLNEGNIGTVDDYLASLIGPQGPPGPQGDPGPQGERGFTGSIDNLDSNNITEALGYTPADKLTVDDLAGVGRTDETVKKNADDLRAHEAEKATQTKLGHIKKQEDWIDGVLGSGWSKYGGGLRYAKNDLGIVTVLFSATSGTIATGTTISTLPVGYRPVLDISVAVVNLSLGEDKGDRVEINSGGQIKVSKFTALTTGQVYQGMISFYGGV